MSYTLVFIAALALNTATRLWLNQRQRGCVMRHRDQVPHAFAEKISIEDHQKAADYTLAKSTLGRWNLMIEVGLLLLWTLGGGIQLVSDFVEGMALGTLWTGAITIVVVLAVSAIVDLPFSLYRTFVIEEKFGFNNTTLKIWLTDMLKATVLALVLGVPFILLILWLLEQAGSYWWLWAWAAFVGFAVTLNWVFPTLIAPLFNQFSPLEDKSLRAGIEALLEKTGFKSNGIFVVDGSRRSGHGNAYFAGFGRSKRIVFYDTLLESLDKNQVMAVLAHELGHFHHRHIVKNLVFSSAMSLAGFAVLAALLESSEFYTGLGVQSMTPANGLLLFSLTVPLVTFFLSPLLTQISRRYEFEADRFAAETTQPHDLITALVRLYQDNASTLTPDPLHSFFYDSHPAASERIHHLETC